MPRASTRAVHRRAADLRYLLVGGLTAAAFAVAAPAATASTSTSNAHSGSSISALSASSTDYRHDCATPAAPGQMRCMALVRTNVTPLLERQLAPNQTPSGYGPSDLRSAYNLTAASSTDGGGATVAVVDAYDDSNAESDLATYRSEYGLPACSSSDGCFQKVNQEGQASPLPSAPPSGDDWTGEESLDLDMVSAACPNCHIILVEANDEQTADLGAAVNAAVQLGAKYVSNSYGGSESSSDPQTNSYYDHPGVVVTASAGDSGYGVEYPAASPDVTSVGGTSLTRGGGSRGWSEVVWGSASGGEGTGSGCSAYETKPSWQQDTGCANRTVADVSSVADPNTGVAVYDTANGNAGWNVYGGTSAASPFIAAVYALAGTPGASDNPAAYPYAHPSDLNDVTSGANGSCSPAYLCTAQVGYDGPTGLGTPNGIAAFAPGSSTGNTVTVTNPGSQTGSVGKAAALQIRATDSASGQTLTYAASGLPTGLSINSGSGLISGTPSTAGTFTVTVTATDSTGAAGSASFSWTISGGTGNTVTVTNPGNQTGTVGTAASLQIKATDSASGQTLTYAASGLPTGLSINSGSGLISGTPSTAGAFTVTVTATDNTGAAGSTSFSWTIASGGGGCSGVPAWDANTAYVPGNEVTYNGHKYLSLWYSTGVQPGSAIAWDIWQDEGAC